ncbi:MAG: 50S ribosomal protein L13 [Nanoarchaeota archaeon]
MENKIVIDGAETVLGRLASYAVKQALLGKTVTIVNCEEVIIKGERRMIINEYKTLVYRGGHSLKGPFHIKRSPERLVKRTIRGMLDYKYQRGEDAFKRIMCYDGVPKEFEADKKISIKTPSLRKNYKLKELAKEF